MKSYLKRRLPRAPRKIDLAEKSDLAAKGELEPRVFTPIF